MIALSFFDQSGIMLMPWADAGYECHSFDIERSRHFNEAPNAFFHRIDLLGPTANALIARVVDNREVAFAAFFPPCTHLANSGNRWKQAKGLPAVIAALQAVNWARETAIRLGAPYLIENPKGALSTWWRKADYIFQPHEYGESYFKETHLWTGNGFIMPTPVPKEERAKHIADKIHFMPAQKNRARMRSLTPTKFATAVYKANGCSSTIKHSTG